MIGGFRHKGLEEIYTTGQSRRISIEHVRKCIRILQALDVATQPENLNVSGYRFHSLHGTPRRWSVRVTGNYRITFGWSGENASDIDFEDYH
ncbi:MAG: type II toxin-antitoxin system RelE/ParE family toxin [Acidobacteriota bacterium]|nr:type II toxin-antitoxin system RelE/ParE family toxin [Acidobacteriota bacterium]